MSFRDIDERSNAFANALLAAGVAPADRVAVMLPNCPEFALTWLSLAKIAAPLVPLNTRLKRVDAAAILSHAEVTAVVTAREYLPIIEAAGVSTIKRIFCVDGGGGSLIDLASAAVDASSPDHRPRPEDIVSIQYTSGTTGAPKGCMLSNSYWAFLVRRLCTEFPGMTTDDVPLTAQPFYYLDPQWNLALALASGASLVVLDGFHPSTFWSQVRRYRTTFFYCLGLMPALLYKSAREEGETDHSLRFVWCSAIPPSLHRGLEQRFQVPWLEISGMTETGADLYVGLEEHDELVGSGCVGRPYSMREARVVDDADRPVPGLGVGELVYRGLGMFDGYFKDGSATQTVFRNGWFHTGDLVRRDEQGRFYYVGRKQEVMRRSGETIAAVEVEDVLLTHEAVSLAACVGVPDEVRGEEIKAYVVLKPGCSAPATPDALASYCLDRLAAFKVPRYWEYRDDLPLTSSERVRKAELVRGVADLRRNAYDRVLGTWRE